MPLLNRLHREIQYSCKIKFFTVFCHSVGMLRDSTQWIHLDNDRRLTKSKLAYYKRKALKILASDVVVLLNGNILLQCTGLNLIFCCKIKQNLLVLKLWKRDVT